MGAKRCQPLSLLLLCGLVPPAVILRYDGPTLPSGRRRKKSLAAVYVEVLIEWYGLGNDRCRRGTRVTMALVTRVQDEAEHRKKKRGCVNLSLGNALDRVVPSGRGRGALSFCQVSVRIHGLRWAEVQLAAQRLSRDTDQEKQGQRCKKQYRLNLAHTLRGHVIPIF